MCDTCVNMCMWRSEINVWNDPRLFAQAVFEVGSLTHVVAHSRDPPAPCLLLSPEGWDPGCHPITILMGSKDLNFGAYSCMARVLTIESSLQALILALALLKQIPI